MFPDKARAFLTFNRELAPHEPPEERLRHYQEFTRSLPGEKVRQQAYRCMNCGVPFCHGGCPLGNQIPDFNERVKDDDWAEALRILHSTNNFPEFTGRVCPAPCEGSCVLGINEPPVAIEMLEREIADRGWAEGWIRPETPAARTGKRVAIIGSGPSGLAAAQQLNRAGHTVTVYERDDEPGGLLTYGIPAFKLDKGLVMRRIQQIRDEGVEFRCNVWVGKNVPVDELEAYDAVLIAAGSTKARTFEGMGIPGSHLKGIHLAMDFLPQQTRRLLGKPVEGEDILATGKSVIVIGGGDTGSDCVGTSLRQGCKSLVNIELLPRPPLARAADNPWPEWPFVYRTSTSHEEGGERDFCILTKKFEDDGNGNVAALHAVRIKWSDPDPAGRRAMTEIPGSELRIPAELVLIAMGFTQPETDTFIADMGLELQKNRFGQAVKADDQRYMTSREGIFACGDARRGQSLVVWAISEGREAARAIDLYLTGCSDLPGKASFGYDTLAPRVS
ncbi:MAG: glutamate synthase subunit beta [Candidatus Hydrogenedentes bacterium]|nr:glutamate synthase subunit beta [Candidatus Hydrogenedentota bacterium]